MVIKINQLIWLFLATVILLSCHSEPFPVKIQSLRKSIWPKDKTLEFDFLVQKPSQSVDMLYQVQYGRDYGFENIWLKYWLIGPRKDTLIISKDNLFLFTPNSGKPIGIGPKQRLFLDAYFLKNVLLKDTGKYKIHIRHYMRKDSLAGIQAMGIKLRESE